MKIIIRVEREGEPPWEEDYEQDVFDPNEYKNLTGLNKPRWRPAETNNPRRWAAELVDWFNRTRREGEAERTLVSVRVVE